MAKLAHCGAMKVSHPLRAARWIAVAALSAGLMGTVGASGSRTNHGSSALTGRMAKFPRLTVWAWERREDLRGLDARRPPNGTPLNAAQADAVALAVSEAAADDAADGAAVAALQVDFDARQSQREWYAGVLRRVRAQMPAHMPLSITALASWCSYDGEWMRALPVDEAVPMLFRMEPDRRRAGMSSSWGTGDFASTRAALHGFGGDLHA